MPVLVTLEAGISKAIPTCHPRGPSQSISRRALDYISTVQVWAPYPSLAPRRIRQFAISLSLLLEAIVRIALCLQQTVLIVHILLIHYNNVCNFFYQIFLDLIIF